MPKQQKAEASGIFVAFPFSPSLERHSQSSGIFYPPTLLHSVGEQMVSGNLSDAFFQMV